MKHQIYCLDLKLGMGEMIWKIENDWYFGQETKRKQNFNEILDKMRHNQACICKCTHFIVSKARCTQTTHKCLRFSTGRKLRAFVRAERVLRICKFPGTGEQREAWPVKESSWEEEGRGNRQERPFRPEAECWCFLEKERKGWAVTGEAARKGRKRGGVWRQNRNGKDEVTLITTLLFGNV